MAAPCHAGFGRMFSIAYIILGYLIIYTLESLDKVNKLKNQGQRLEIEFEKNGLVFGAKRQETFRYAYTSNAYNSGNLGLGAEIYVALSFIRHYVQILRFTMIP